MKRRTKAIVLLTALYSAIGLLLTSYRYLDDLARQVHGTLPRRLIEELTGAYSALVLFPFIAWMTRRFPISRTTWQVALPMALLGAIAYSVAHTTLMALSRAIIFPLCGLGSYDYGIMLYRYPMEMSNDFLIYTVVSGFVYFIDRADRARRAEVAAADLQTKLAQAQLENLRLQLNPHFIFNTLNAISAVMYEDVRKADAMLAKLSDFLRTVLASSGVHQVPLDEELAVERMYVEIMTTRLERSFALDLRIDESARRAVVPFMILQPLLENSIRHGMPPGRSSLAIRIDIVRENGSTVIRVADDGSGFAPAPAAAGNGGHGLGNVRSRLQYMYGDAAALSIGPNSGGGTTAVLTFPYLAQDRA